MKREIYPRHRADCPNRFSSTVAKDGKEKQLHPRKKFDGCRVYARYTVTDPHSGELLEEFNGALPPHILTKDAADTYVNQRFAVVIEKHHRGDDIPSVNRGVTVKVAAEKYLADQKRRFPSLPPVQMSDNVRRAQERVNVDGKSREHEIIGKIEFLIKSRFVQYFEDRKIRTSGP